MQFKSKSKPHLKESNINNVITTVNLKIKDIHILLDDISTKNKDYNNSSTQKSNIYTKNIPNLSSFSTINAHKIYYHKRNINNSLKNSPSAMRTIPISIKRNNFSTNNTGSMPSFSTTIDINNNSNLKNNFSRNNYLNSIKTIRTEKIIFSKDKNIAKKKIFNRRKYNSTFGRIIRNNNSYFKHFHSEYNQSPKNIIYIKKVKNENIRYSNNNINTSKNNIKPFILTSSSPKNFYSNDNFYLDNSNSKSLSNNNLLNSDLDTIGSNNSKKIKYKKIKFNFKINDNKYNNKDKPRNNYKNNYLLYLKSSIIIQKWWKNMKKISVLKYFVIMLQKVFRGYILRKKINSVIINSNKNKTSNFLTKKIPKYNCIYYFFSKSFYKNNLPSIALLQREIRKFLLKVQLYKCYNIEKNGNYEFHFLKQKPKANICYITKCINKSPIKKMSFINKKIKCIANNKNSKTIKIEKDNNKIISNNNNTLNDSSNSMVSNITAKYFNFHNNMITIQTIDSKESQDICKFDFFNKNNINKNYRPFYFLQNLFKNNIIHKLYLILLKMKYNYINLSNFIKAIFKAIITSKKRTFLEYLSFYGNNKFYINKKRKNFLNAIIRHINIYKKNNNIKNEVIQLIEKSLPQNLNINKINMENKDLLLNISSIQEENLINSQIFINNDNNLVNYICLFFKYEKNKNNINYNFIQNRLIKEPLKFRNIFTILRYIDNLDDKINNKKICMICFCKKNEKKCILNCNCHNIPNILNGNYLNNFVPKMKCRKGSLKKININLENNNDKDNKNININKLEKIINKNGFLLEKINEGNNSEEYYDTESINISNISKENQVKEIHINKAFTYFSK